MLNTSHTGKATARQQTRVRAKAPFNMMPALALPPRTDWLFWIVLGQLSIEA